jgi:hypothetical protein
MREQVYFGRLCPKHPELNGERWIKSYRCVECLRIYQKKYYAAQKEKNNGPNA